MQLYLLEMTSQTRQSLNIPLDLLAYPLRHMGMKKLELLVLVDLWSLVLNHFRSGVTSLRVS